MQPVWVLSVDLQTKTATFQTGLSDAARAARGAFTDIKGGSNEMGRSVGGNMMEARHGVMLLGEEFGVHLPRALTSFIASIGPIGAAMEAAFPFLAIAVGATLLIEHLVKMHEAGEKLTEDQIKFGTAAQNAFNQLDQKLLQSQIRADNLRNDHMGALRHELELIDHQSMDELVHSFELLAKAADVVFGDLKTSWYEFGKGSDGAKHALDDFQNRYDNLLAKGDDKGASGLLHGTLDQAQKVLGALKDTENFRKPDQTDDTYQKGIEAAKTLQGIQVATGVSLGKQIEAQQRLVDVLQDQVTMEGKVAALKGQDSANAKTETAKDLSGQRSAAEKEAVDSQLRLGQIAIASDRATADAQMSIHHASLEERLASDIDFANRERDVQLAANQGQIAALDKMGKDYQNQLKALNDKALEITAQNEAQVTELKARASAAINARDLADLEQSEREKIEATRQGSEARVQAVDAAIRRTQALGLQDSEFYRGLLSQRVQAARQEAEEEGKLAEEAGRQQAQADLQAGELILAAHRQAIELTESLTRVSNARQLSDQIQFANLEYALKEAEFKKEIAALDQNGKEYWNKLKELQDKERQLTQQHENEIAAIKAKAQTQQNQDAMAAITQLEQLTAAGLTQVIMRHQSFAQMLDSIGNQVISGMLRTALMSAMTLDADKEKQAASAARKFFNAGASMPFPLNIVMAPVLAAGAFAAVMAFEQGGIVPGVGRGDIVPAMLTPGEAVLPKEMTEGLQRAARGGGFEQGPATHVHQHVTYHVNTIDGDGMHDALEKHSDQLHSHFEKAVRRMNR